MNEDLNISGMLKELNFENLLILQTEIEKEIARQRVLYDELLGDLEIETSARIVTLNEKIHGCSVEVSKEKDEICCVLKGSRNYMTQFLRGFYKF